MIRLSLLFLFFVFTLVSLSGQVVWKQHLEGVETEVLSILPKSKPAHNKKLELVGIQNNTIKTTLYNGKKTLNFMPLSPQVRSSAAVVHPLQNQTFLLVQRLNTQIKARLIDAKLHTLKAFTFDVNAEINAVEKISDGWIMVGEQRGEMFAMRVKEDGAILWQKSFGGRGALLDVSVTPAGRVFFVGFVDLFQSGETDCFITEFDLDGKNKWEKVLGTPENLDEKARLVTLTDDEDILVVGNRGKNIWIMQLDKEQVVTWEEEIKSEQKKLTPTALYAQEDGTTILAATVASTAGHHLMLMELNTKLMTSANDLLGRMHFRPVASSDQKSPLSIHYKSYNHYYQVTSNTKELNALDLYGKFPSSHYVYVLGVSAAIDVDVVSEQKLDAIYMEKITTIDLKKYDYLILLLSDEPCDIHRIKEELNGKKNLIRRLPAVLGKRLFQEKDVLYISHELAAYARFEHDNQIVPFFIKLK